MTTTKHWRYDVPSAPGVDRAVVFVDALGVFSCVSAYGAWGYWWSPNNCRDCREFILGLADDVSYAANKLARGHRIYDSETTLKSIKRLFWESMPARWDVCRHNDALEELEGGFEGVDNESDFYRWADRSEAAMELDIDAVHGCHAQMIDPQLMAFCTLVLPRLSAMIRAELEAEGYFAERQTAEAVR